MSYNWRLGGRRSANMMDAHPERMESADGQRWACGRTVKGETSTPGVYVPVEVWALKHRVDGKAVTVDSGMPKEVAERWVNEGKTRWQS